MKELHALWDSGVYKYQDDTALPLTDASWDKIGAWSKDIRSNYPESSFSELDNDVTTWSNEGFTLAKDFVYKNIQQNTLPSDEYVKGGQVIVDKQLAKGGYRLAKIFLDSWSKKATIKSFLQK